MRNILIIAFLVLFRSLAAIPAGVPEKRTLLIINQQGKAVIDKMILTADPALLPH